VQDAAVRLLVGSSLLSNHWSSINAAFVRFARKTAYSRDDRPTSLGHTRGETENPRRTHGARSASLRFSRVSSHLWVTDATMAQHHAPMLNGCPRPNPGRPRVKVDVFMCRSVDGFFGLTVTDFSIRHPGTLGYLHQCCSSLCRNGCPPRPRRVLSRHDELRPAGVEFT
jgi:hypothetical protein